MMLLCATLSLPYLRHCRESPENANIVKMQYISENNGKLQKPPYQPSLLCNVRTRYHGTLTQ